MFLHQDIRLKCLQGGVWCLHIQTAIGFTKIVKSLSLTIDLMHKGKRLYNEDTDLVIDKAVNTV